MEVGSKKSWPKANIVLGGVVFLILAIPTFILGVYYYRNANDDLTKQLFSRREIVAGLSASAIKIKLDHLVEIAELYASQDNIRNRVAAKDWGGATNSVILDLSNRVEFYDFFVDRILLIDAEGIVRDAFPRLYGGIGQKDVAFDEWAAPILKNGQKSFVSNVHKRIAAPRVSIVEVLAPITKNSKIVGAVALQIPINEFSDFGKDIEVGSRGFAYFVDRLGQIVSHPKYSSDGPIVDFSGVPSVQKLMRGEEGVEILYNQIEREERISAYQIVPVYGWGVVAVEPTKDAFETRDGILYNILLLIAIIFLIDLMIAILIYRSLGGRQKYE